MTSSFITENPQLGVTPRVFTKRKNKSARCNTDNYHLVKSEQCGEIKVNKNNASDICFTCSPAGWGGYFNWIPKRTLTPPAPVELNKQKLRLSDRIISK